MISMHLINRNSTNRDVISLFSGAMGLDIGLSKAGLNVVIGQDFEPSCVKTMQENGLFKVRNLGLKSEREIRMAFVEECYLQLLPYEKGDYWQRFLDQR